MFSSTSGPITVDDISGKSCWICAESEDDDDAQNGSSKFVHPCGCSLVAHATCLFSWIDAQQKSSPRGLNFSGAGAGGRAGGQDPHSMASARCPQCQQPYRITDAASRPERWLRSLLSRSAHTLSNHTGTALLAALGAGAYVICNSYGRLATRLLVGRKLANRVFGRTWSWHLYVDIPLVPFVLIVMRLPVLLSPSYWIVPTLLMLPFVQRPPLNSGSRFGVDGFTRRLLRGDLSPASSASNRSGLWPPTPAMTLLLVPWARMAYFPLRRAVYRMLFRSWYRVEAKRKAAALALPRPRPSAAQHMMDTAEGSTHRTEDVIAGVAGDDGDVHEILHATDDENRLVYLTSHGHVRVEWLVAFEQPTSLVPENVPFTVSAEQGREPYVDPGIAAEDVTFKNWERRTVQYPAPSFVLTADARRALEVLDTLLAVGDEDEISEAERRVAAALQRCRSVSAETSPNSRPVLRVEYCQMEEVHRLFITPASVARLMIGGLTLPIFAAVGGSVLWHLSNFVPSLRHLLGLSQRKLTVGSAALSSTALGLGYDYSMNSHPSDGDDWSVWDTITGEDPVWWRNALGAALWIATRDLAVATLRLLRYRAQRSRQLKSLPFAPSQVDTLNLRPERRLHIQHDSNSSSTPS